MKLFTKNSGSNYLAKVVKLPKLEKHPNADRLQIAVIDNQTVIVGMDAKEGDVCIFVPLEAAVNKAFLGFTNSFENQSLNDNRDKKGFFKDQGRVRAVKLRGVPSEGYVIPAREFLVWIYSGGYPFDVSVTLEALDIGKEFDTIELPSGKETLFCEKYIPKQQHSSGPANQPRKDKAKRFNRLVEGQFHFHNDTANLRKNIHVIKPDDIISITEKLHGTSAIFSNILVKRKLSRLERIAKWFGIKVQETEYDSVYSSRSVIKNQYLYEEDKKHNHFYKEDIWAHARKYIEHALKPGITIYAEIVGQTPGGKWIQKNYDYGTSPNTFEVYVYRITFVNPTGDVIEFSTPQIKRYCETYNLKMVPLHYYGYARNRVAPYDLHGKPDTRDFGIKLLEYICSEFLEKPCQMSKNKVPREGVVISIEGSQFNGFKAVSFAFKERETKLLDEGEVSIDQEEESNALAS
jgi:hypothetical protein